MKFLEDALQQGHVALYDFRGQHLPDLISDKQSGTVSLFLKEGKEKGFQSSNFQVQRYKSLTEIRSQNNHPIDINILDGEAIKLLLAKFPPTAPYVMVPIALRSGWLVGLPGLLRRLALGYVRLNGIATLKSGGGSQRWLVIQRRNYKFGGATLSDEVGIQGLLDYLREEKVQYVVLKSFEKLPELFREHGDLDLLVVDEEHEKIMRFLTDHPGTIKIDVCPVSSPWYPPTVAARIVQTAVAGPAGSRVPAPKDALLANAYNAVYIKGFDSGIPSRMPDAEVNPNPKNDYGGIIAHMAKNLNIQIPIEMESLEEYLHQEGWRPEHGSFVMLANRNAWLRRHFWTDGQSIEVGLGVLILKQKALRLGLVDRIIEEIERKQFTVLRKKILDEDGKDIAMKVLRGGNWRSASGDESHDFTPAIALIILDTRPYSVFQAKRGLATSRVLPLKTELRKRFDDEQTSVVHSTDIPGETWEYIEVCFPDEIKEIREQINEYFLRFEASFREKFRFSVLRRLAPRNLRQITHRLLIRRFVQ